MVLDRGPGQALVADGDLAGLEAASVKQRHGDLPLAQLGLASHQATGLPSGVHSSYGFKPQEKREWLGHQP